MSVSGVPIKDDKKAENRGASIKLKKQSAA